ncbi:MAG TPA: DUF2256 domain-containing protein [Limnobacter sp.]|uniref:DUF2256 domain-containing protein n=1 Tax=Limnobacter sp. TaxID=2003368 RepID=UPI002ED87CDD
MTKPSSTRSTFKGNKSALPSKPCAVCGRDMTWRKSWAKNWDDVKYCSEACRKQRKGASHGE